MKVIKESKGVLGKLYNIYIDNKLIKQVKIIRVSKVYMNFHYVFLFNSNGQVIKEVFEFLNSFCKSESLNSREQSANALKLLYSFREIIGKEFEDFQKKDINCLSEFIQGISIEGNIERYVLSTSRTITTHNLYFDAIRKFFKFTNIENEDFFINKVVNIEKNGFGMYAHTKRITTEKYTTNKSRHNSFSQYVPKYISISEYRKILQYIDESKSEYKSRNKLIIKLMYTRGLRLGEVLGITLEDITSYPNDLNAGLLYLRNRVSDKKFQKAKTCIKAFSKDIYKTKAYREEGRGYQTIILSKELYKEIHEYIEESRDLFSMSETKIHNIMNFSVADSVNNESEINYYLFLNKNGMPLSSSGWNKILKGMFLGIGLTIDKDYKRDNLSHRFRHGYAMYLIEVLKKELVYVKEEMRHRSIQSTLKYYNPKPNTILKETESIQKSIKDKFLRNE